MAAAHFCALLVLQKDSINKTPLKSFVVVSLLLVVCEGKFLKN